MGWRRKVRVTETNSYCVSNEEEMCRFCEFPAAVVVGGAMTTTLGCSFSFHNEDDDCAFHSTRGYVVQ